jgi:hypothetical protein
VVTPEQVLPVWLSVSVPWPTLASEAPDADRRDTHRGCWEPVQSDDELDGTELAAAAVADAAAQIQIVSAAVHKRGR